MKIVFLFIGLFISINLNVFSQCRYTISPNPKTASCFYAFENAVLTSQVYTAISINPSNAAKNIAGNAWNSGAFTTNSVANNGWIEASTNVTNQYKILGLSNTNPDATNTSIQFGLYLRGDGNIEILESGVSRGLFGPYAITQRFKIKVENNVVKYYRDNTLLYISTVAPTLPLFGDFAF